MTRSRNRAWRLSSVVLACGAVTPLALTGCAPTGYQIASMVADGVSYIVSGKSLTDHGLSLVMNEDCATLRAVEGKPICTAPSDTTLASNKKKSKGTKGTQVAQADDAKAQSHTGKTATGDAKSGDGAAKSDSSTITKNDDNGLIPSHFKAPTPVEISPLAPARTGKRSQTARQDVAAASDNPDTGGTGRYVAATGDNTTGNNDEKVPHVMPGENVAALEPADTGRDTPTTGSATSVPVPKIYYAGSADRRWDWSGQRVALNGY